MSPIQAFIEAGKKFESDRSSWNEFIVRSEDAAPEIEELRNLCRKITTRGKTVSEEDVERIRELVNG